MKLTRARNRSVSNIFMACLMCGLMTACAVVGPASINTGRGAYNEAITSTNNQQVLKIIIENRYGEPGGMLAVASVTANVRIATSSGIEAGFGSDSNYNGNLVPFGAGILYEENPTISYVPVAGAKYAHRMMSPTDLTGLAQLTGNLSNVSYVFTSLIASVNDIYNPDFLYDSVEIDPRFERFAAVMTRLIEVNRLHWRLDDPFDANKISIVIDHYSPTYAAEVDELLKLLNLPLPEDYSQQLVIPVYRAIDGSDVDGVRITTQSVWNLVEVMSAAVDVPQADKNAGVTANYPPLGQVGADLRIPHADERPDTAFVAVEHRGKWFYIEEGDLASKQLFRLLSTLWGVTIAEATANSVTAPVLTIPASR